MHVEFIRATFMSCFSHFIRWALGIEFRFSGFGVKSLYVLRLTLTLRLILKITEEAKLGVEHMPVNPKFKRLSPEDCEFEVSLGCAAKSCLRKQCKTTHIPIAPPPKKKIKETVLLRSLESRAVVRNSIKRHCCQFAPMNRFCRTLVCVTQPEY